MQRREFLKYTLAAAGALASYGCSSSYQTKATDKKRPNVVIIYTDDQNFEHIGCYGNKVLTPYQDQLAADGVLFTRGYTASSICTPSRFSCLTGKYPSRCGHPEYIDKYPAGSQTAVGFDTHLYEKSPSLASVMQDNGYKTGMVGKWHLGAWYFSEKLRHPDESYTKDPWISAEHQYDPCDPEVVKELEKMQDVWSRDIQRFGFDSAERIYFSVSQSFRNHKLNSHNLEWTVEGALDFIEDNKDDNFFLYFAPTLHHDPQPQKSLLGVDPKLTPAGCLDKLPDAGMPTREDIYNKVVEHGYDPQTAYCTWLDEGIGAVMNKLKREGLYEDTMIILCSDNQLIDKVSLYEGGVKVPLMVSWPGCIKGGQVCDQLVQNIDFVPTILSACGIGKPSNMHLDGKNILPMLAGGRKFVHDDLFFEIGWTRAICTDKYKYIALRYPDNIQKEIDEGKHYYHFTPLEFYQIGIMLRHPDYFDADQLYDIEADPGETNNLAGKKEYREILEDCRKRLASYLHTFEGHPFGEFNNTSI
jgi:arylsulfatase A-like enzyme